MSLSQKELSFIQKAGQAAHTASQAIGLTVRTQGEVLVANLSGQPFGAESNEVIERFKSLSSLSHGLSAVESELQKLFALANELAGPAAKVIVLQDVSRHKTISNASAEDVSAKPARAAKKIKTVKKAGRKDAPTAGLTANDSKLLSYLQGALKADAGTAMTGTAMAAGAKLPLGSVGISLKRLAAVGAVKLVGRGVFQLGEGSASFAAVAEPTKNAKAAAKKARAAKAEDAVGKVATPEIGRKAKAVAKKGKARVSAAVTPVGEVIAATV